MLELFIASPDKEIYKGKARQITLPSSVGVITVLPGHEPLMTTIGAGEMYFIDENNKDYYFSAFMGVVNIENNKGESRVSVLLERSENVQDIDEAAALSALERAKQANVEKGDDLFGMGTTNMIMKEMNRVKLARKHKPYY